MIKIVNYNYDCNKNKNDNCSSSPTLPTGSYNVNLAVVGDSHVGYQNSRQSMFRAFLPRVVSSGNKRYIIFGGDNAHALGAFTSQEAERYYQQFTDIVDGVLTPRNIYHRTSIGNWEDTDRNNSRNLFLHYFNDFTGRVNIPATQGLVQHVWLDNGTGTFSPASINLLNSLDANHYYIIDFHWPLYVPGIYNTVNRDHVVSRQETNRFFNAIPANVRNRILGIFTHHAHVFYSRLTNIHANFPNTPFFVTGCSGDYSCTSAQRGYYDVNLTIQNNNQATLQATRVILP
ncbi:hypothetical protein [Bacillus sp. OTU530]|uniref:hypothetical protein n=1 Tax=Bacillus sp. OTU530 TaxID=3043862 RepID=UPI00313C2B76